MTRLIQTTTAQKLIRIRNKSDRLRPRVEEDLWMKQETLNKSLAKRIIN
jgi:hypothetical protein